MFKLAVIEESLEQKQQVLNNLNVFFFSQRIENVPDDTESIWHTNEYHIEEKEINNVLHLLKDQVKLTWYIHAFSDEKLFVVLREKVFEISPHKDSSWDEMIEYGINVAQVERDFLENIPLHV